MSTKLQLLKKKSEFLLEEIKKQELVEAGDVVSQASDNVSAIPSKTVNPLHEKLMEELVRVRQKRNFDPELFINSRCSDLLRYLKKYNIGSLVLSISGGVDSAAVLGLLASAQKMAPIDHPFHPSNGGKIIAVAQPISSTPEIQNRAYEVAAVFGITVITVDQTVQQMMNIDEIESQVGSLKGFAVSMNRSYMRTPIAYLLASHYGGIVVGTGNMDEDGYLFYYCKFGDGAVDVGLIWDLHKSEVFRLAEHLGVPRSILVAPPSADLGPGQTDETEIGSTYNMVELIWTYLKVWDESERISFKENLCSEALEQFDREFAIVEEIHLRGLHKADINPKNIGNGSAWFEKWSSEQC